jgi:hypothetical protein
MPHEGFVTTAEAPIAEAQTTPDARQRRAPPQSRPQPQPQPQLQSEPQQQPEPPSAEVTDLRQEWPIVVKLRHKSIIGNKREELNELRFREPTGSDIVRIGNPVFITAAGEIMFDERKMTAMMAQLAGVFPPLLDAMHPQDWNSCAYRLRRFFLPDPEAW